MENLLSNFEQLVSHFLQTNQSLPFPSLVSLAFLGGLAASLTPCVLPMMPLYLGYIGATNITSKVDVLKKTSLFCLGSALIFSLMGLFASFANFVIVEFRGYVHVAIGLLLLFMALSVIEVIKMPLPQFIKNIPEGGPFIVGLAFASISSPCASPILFAVLAMSSTAGSFLKGTSIMVAYSIGYTGLIFVTGLFAGFVKRLNFFKRHSKIVSIISSIVLVVLGALYIYSGIKWFSS